MSELGAAGLAVAAVAAAFLGIIFMLGGFDADRHNTYNMNLDGREYVCKSYPNKSQLTVCKSSRNIPLP